MNHKTSTQVRVGIFVSLGIVLSMVVIFLLGGEKSFFERHYSLYSRFDNISGLRIGASVFLAGITVGSVEDIRFPKELDERDVVVRMRIASKYQDRIRGNSESVIATQGLLGDKMIQISVGSPDLEPLNDGDLLKTKKNSVSIEDFATKGGELIANVNNLVKDIQTKEGFVHALIYDIKGATIIEDLSSVMKSAGGVIREVQHGYGVLHSLIYDKTDRNLAKNFSVAIDNMKKTSQNLSDMTTKIDKGEGSIGGLINDPTVYYDLKTLMGKANRSRLIQAVIRHTLSQNEKDTLK